MTPDLIALVLSLPLPVRLALLDADPNAPGWYINSVESSVFVHREQYGPARLLHYVKDFGDAWLPCNPLAIVEHAARLRFGPSGWFANLSSDDGRAGQYRASIVRHSGENDRAADGECPHTAAIALLREVVGV